MLMYYIEKQRKCTGNSSAPARNERRRRTALDRHPACFDKLSMRKFVYAIKDLLILSLSKDVRCQCKPPLIWKRRIPLGNSRVHGIDIFRVDQHGKFTRHRDVCRVESEHLTGDSTRF